VILVCISNLNALSLKCKLIYFEAKMTKSEILNDLDYVKTLAEEGRHAPSLGGRMGVWWGTLLCLTLFSHWLIVTERVSWEEPSLGLLWIAFGVIGYIGSSLLVRTLRGKPGASATNNRVANALWTGNTILLFLFGLSAGLSAGFGVNSFEIMNMMMPIAFGLYGLTAFVQYHMTEQKSQLVTSVIGFAFVPLTLFMLSSPNLFLVAILGVVMTILIPDAINLRREPKTVV